MATITTTTTTNSLLFHHSTTHLRRNNHHNLHHHHHPTTFSLQNPTSLFLPPLKLTLKTPSKPNSIKPHYFKPSTFSSLNPNFTQTPQFLPNSTKTLTTLFTKIAQFIIITPLLKLKTLISSPNLHQLKTLQNDNVGPLFFAAIQGGSMVNTPLTVVAAGMAKWLDIYSGVLMVRVLLSWFPNIPWDRQPLSAIRDLCDPYLNLFRNIIPPVFDTLDVSPLLAFAVLGVLGSILKNTTNAAVM